MGSGSGGEQLELFGGNANSAPKLGTSCWPEYTSENVPRNRLERDIHIADSIGARMGRSGAGLVVCLSVVGSWKLETPFTRHICGLEARDQGLLRTD